MGTRVYVGNLPFDVRERDLEKFFSGFGRILDILIKDGFAFVEFDDHRDAEDAVFELSGRSLLDSRVKLEIARGPVRRGYGGRGGGDRYGPRKRNNWIDKYGPPTRTKYRLIVENLSSRVSWQDLKDFMRQAGEVTYADAHKQRKNEGVVEFASYSDMKSAMSKLNDSELSGRIIKLIEDTPHGSGRRSSSRSYSRSRSRSRSRSPRRRHGSGSRSRSRSKSRSRSRSRSNKRSLSPVKQERSRSRSCSMPKESPKEEARSRSLSRSPKQEMDDEE